MATAMTLRRRDYLEELKEKGFLMCGICGFGIDNPKLVTVDHIIPKSRGGGNYIGNFQPAHEMCNQKKANMYQDPNHDIGFHAPRDLKRDDLPERWGNKRSYQYRKQMKVRKDERRN